MRRKRVAAGLCLAALAAAAPKTAAASCGQAQCSIDPRLSAGELPARQLRLDLSTEYIEQDQPWVDYHSTDVGAVPTGHHDEVETTNLTWKLRAEAGVSDRWRVALLVPLLHRDHQHLAVAEESNHAPARRPRHTLPHDDGDDDTGEVTIGDSTGVPESWEFTRLGDLQLTASYTVVKATQPQELSLRFYAGLKLPTGETGVRNGDGEKAEITLQPGTGSVDPIFGATLERSFSVGKTGTLLPVAAGINVRTEGSDGEYGYRPGTEVIASVAGEYPLTRRLQALGQINFRYRDRDHVGDAPGVPKGNTGGEALYLSPGVRVMLTDSLGAYSYVQVPVMQRVNGIQLVSEWNLLAGLTYELDI